MNSNKILILALILSVLTCKSLGQNSGSKNNLKTKIEFSETLSIYSLYKNPAFLSDDSEDERLNVKTDYQTRSGSLRKFTAPEKINLYSIRFGGKKHITSRQIFKGEFQFAKDVFNDRDWFSTKNTEDSFPFLIGDSSKGDVRYNCLKLNASYSNRITEQFSFGAKIMYGVDEGLKKVFPRPTSTHRDIDFSLGIGYLPHQNIKGGLELSYFDYDEEIEFKEDKGSLYKENIIFKLRGYDYPLRITQKTLTWHSGSKGVRSIVSSLLKNEEMSLYVSASLKYSKTEFEEGAEKLLKMGYLNKEQYGFNGHFTYQFNEETKLGIFGGYEDYDCWGKHPDYSILIYEETNEKYNAGFNFLFNLSDKLTLLTECKFSGDDRNMADYYGNLNYDLERVNLISSVSARYLLNNDNHLSVEYSYSTSVKNDYNYIHSNNSKYFNDFLSKDIYYTLSEINSHNFMLKWNCRSLELFEFEVVVKYNYQNLIDNSFWKDKNYEAVSCGLNLKIN